MSGFKNGDVVVCVSDDQDRCPFPENHESQAPDNSFVGSYLTIADMYIDWGGCLILKFNERNDDGWCSGCFRKIQKADTSFTAQMRALKPIKQQA